MSAPPWRIAVAAGPWCEGFVRALERRPGSGTRFQFEVVDLCRHDWIAQVTPCDLLLWQWGVLGPEFTGYLKEKAYFAERYLGKLLVPSFDTVWHYDSKIAQSYLFELFGVPVPRTVATFSGDDALAELKSFSFPVVTKTAHGASSEGVSLLADRRAAQRRVRQIFWFESWERHKRRFDSRLAQVITGLPHGWFWRKLRQRLRHWRPWGAMYWQQFVPGNSADVRIFVVGDSYAVAAWRKNRPNDFRASGSGVTDYESQVPPGPIRYCMALSRRFDFDCMAYDVLFRPNDFVITEISYTTEMEHLYDAPHHFELAQDGELHRREGHTWPQEPLVEWALRRLEARAEPLVVPRSGSDEM